MRHASVDRPALRAMVGLAALCISAVSTPALAICNGAYLFYSEAGDGTPLSPGYIYTPGVDAASSPSQTTVTGAVQGSFWMLGFGNPDLHNGIDNGSFPAWGGVELEAQLHAWLYAYPGYPTVIYSQWGASQGIDGCIAALDEDERCMIVLLSDQNDATGYFALLGTTPDSLVRSVFSPSPEAHFRLAALPTPKALSVAASGAGEFTLAVAAPSVESGLYVDPGCLELGDPVVGYRIHQQRLEPGTLPAADRNVEAGWFGTTDQDVCGQPEVVALGEALDIEISCNRDTDVYLALSLVFDSGFETPVVSADSAVFECRVCAEGTDADGDGFCTSAAGPAAADCDDTDASVYPGAPEECDGVRNDCSAPDWPAVPSNEVDDDGDGLAACTKTISIELPADNCPGVANPDQADRDGDGIGDACDASPGGGRGLSR